MGTVPGKQGTNEMVMVSGLLVRDGCAADGAPLGSESSRWGLDVFRTYVLYGILQHAAKLRPRWLVRGRRGQRREGGPGGFLIWKLTSLSSFLFSFFLQCTFIADSHYQSSLKCDQNSDLLLAVSHRPTSFNKPHVYRPIMTSHAEAFLKVGRVGLFNLTVFPKQVLANSNLVIQPPRRRDRLLGLFSRSRSPSPSPSKSRANNAKAFSANQSLSLATNGDRGPHESVPYTVPPTERHNVTSDEPNEPVRTVYSVP